MEYHPFQGRNVRKQQHLPTECQQPTMEVNSENLQKDQRQNGGDETYDKHRLELSTTKHRHPHITNANNGLTKISSAIIL